MVAVVGSSFCKERFLRSLLSEECDCGAKEDVCRGADPSSTDRVRICSIFILEQYRCFVSKLKKEETFSVSFFPRVENANLQVERAVSRCVVVNVVFWHESIFACGSFRSVRRQSDEIQHENVRGKTLLWIDRYRLGYSNTSFIFGSTLFIPIGQVLQKIQFCS